MSPRISLTVEPDRLIESEATAALLTLTLDQPPPPSGVVVTLNAPDLSDFDLTKARVEGGEVTLEPALQQQLQDALDGTRAPEVPGAVVAIVSPFGTWHGASGIANVENDVPLDVNDRFQIGSITKTFVATTALQLVEEGQLSLDDTLTTLLPDSLTADIPNAGDITLRNLLQHTSGVADYLGILFTQAASNPAVFLQDWQPAELIDLIDGEASVFAPGESWQYSNTNFILAGLIIEAVTGNSIAQEIRDRILTPLNLENTYFAEEETIPGGVVDGYWDFDGNGTLDNVGIAPLSWAWAAGAMVSNAEDLDTFARHLFKGESGTNLEPLLQPQTLAQMLDTVSAIDNNNYSSYGLGVGTIESPARFWLIHRGQTLGHRSNMWYSPEDDLTYIELINGFSDDNLVRDILPPFRRGVTDETFQITLFEQTAQVILPVDDDRQTEGEETATFSLTDGEGYEVDPNAQTGTIVIVDSADDLRPSVALRLSPNEVSEGQTLTFLFEVSDIPEDGLYVYVDSDSPQSLAQFAFEQSTVNGADAPVLNPDSSGFAIKISDVAAELTLPVIADDLQEGTLEVAYELETRDEISAADLAAIETFDTIDDYTISPSMAGEAISILDPAVDLQPPTDDNGSDEHRFFGTALPDEFRAGVSPGGFNGSNDLVFAAGGDDLLETSTGTGNNRLYGQSGDDTFLIGNNDTAFGGEGEDVFYLLGANNQINGGADADEFWVGLAERPESVNTIGDFEMGTDLIGIALGIDFSELTATQENNDTLISHDDQVLVRLLGVTASSLTESDFALI